MRLAGARCLVVGGVHRLGRALALDLAAHGAAVAVCSRAGTPRAERRVAALARAGAAAAAGRRRRRGHGRRRRRTSSPAPPPPWAASTRSSSRRAAPSCPRRRSDIDEAAWDASLDTIAKGFFFTRLRRRTTVVCRRRRSGEATSPPRRGVIVAITDCMGLQPWASFAAHGAAKAAQIHLVKQLARAWAADGVRVCGVAPGPVDLARRPAPRRDAARGRQAAMGAAGAARRRWAPPCASASRRTA